MKKVIFGFCFFAVVSMLWGAQGAKSPFEKEYNIRDVGVVASKQR